MENIPYNVFADFFLINTNTHIIDKIYTQSLAGFINYGKI